MTQIRQHNKALLHTARNDSLFTDRAPSLGPYKRQAPPHVLYNPCPQSLAAFLHAVSPAPIIINQTHFSSTHELCR